MRVLRVHHGGREPGQRCRERALVARGVDVTLVVPRGRSPGHARENFADEPFRVVELDVERPGDAARYRFRDPAAVREVIELIRPDVLDLHEEPVSPAARQWLRAAGDLPVALHTSQNLDQRLPPPLAQRERRVLGRADALYPCSRQAASVARGKGFAGVVDVIPPGYDDTLLYPGGQSSHDPEAVLGVVGPLTPQRGLLDAVRVLAEVRRARRARLLVVGEGPALPAGQRLAADLGVGDALVVVDRCPPPQLAELYRRMHVVLLPSRSTPRWVERRARVAIEAQASGAVVAGYGCGVIPEVAGRAGVIVPEGDHWGLARAVARLLADPEEYAWRRAAAVRTVPFFTWAHIAGQQAEMYRRILSGVHERVPMARSAARRREHARSEFGFPARPVSASRPFVLPASGPPSARERTGAAWPAAARAVVAPLRVDITSHLNRYFG